eukprot:CAMPEP_0170389108 /NCGR_PEP_ID=MMETSP0117_2-20130122/18441_1 /TAXON_ID=400756 /ORGANISM="Durinskia baltica, Strain CSIRO CS-38" /LENGTH=106 /DNA_ID=CAMNT_0010645073 /DNA_START=39 /DNA_END=356 /DNA_ORIENTATION=+
MDENTTHLAGLSASFDEALSAARQGGDSTYTFSNNIAFITFSVDPNITMVSIITRPDEASRWLNPGEDAPPLVYAALITSGFSEEAENGFTIDRPAADVSLLLSLW